MNIGVGDIGNSKNKFQKSKKLKCEDAPKDLDTLGERRRRRGQIRQRRESDAIRAHSIRLWLEAEAQGSANRTLPTLIHSAGQAGIRWASGYPLGKRVPAGQSRVSAGYVYGLCLMCY